MPAGLRTRTAASHRSFTMTDPNDSDDTWGDLARELGLDEPPRPAEGSAAPHDEPLSADEDAGEFEDAGLVEAEPGAVEAESDESESEGDPGEAPADDSQSEPGRKRRRRRRRRKKGGPALAASETAEANDEAAEDPDTDEASVTSSVEESPDIAESDDTEEIEPAAVPLAVEEETGSEVLRELIANWNVPSWDEIIGGLYRPDR